MPYCGAQRDTDNAVGDRTGFVEGVGEGDLVGPERPGGGVRCQTDFLCPECHDQERLPAGTGKRCLANVCKECNGAGWPPTCDVCGNLSSEF